MNKTKLGILISGSGTNLQALIDACKDENYPAVISVVISNNANAYGLQRAREAGIDVAVIDHRDYEDRDNFEEAITAELESHSVRLVCLAGFMRILNPAFVRRWTDRMINIHPSLLPSYKGLHTHERALEDGVRITGCTVHFVRADVDTGPIIIQAAVPVLPNDTTDCLATRVLEAEHIIYPEAVRLVASGIARVRGFKVIIDGMPTPDHTMVSPLPNK